MSVQPTVTGLDRILARKAEEVADGILYLLSDKASYVTGTILDITGGR